MVSQSLMILTVMCITAPKVKEVKMKLSVVRPKNYEPKSAAARGVGFQDKSLGNNDQHKEQNEYTIKAETVQCFPFSSFIYVRRL